MDLGLFRRSRAQFWAWIGGPILVIVVATYALQSYSGRVERALTERRSLTEVIPEMQIQLGAAKETLQRFALVPPTRSDATERVRARMNRCAEQSGFIVNALNVEQPDATAPRKPTGVRGRKPAPAKAAAPDDTTPFLEVTVNGEGALPAVLRFMDEALGSTSLVTAESAALKMTRNVPEPFYTAQLVLRCYLVSL